MIEHFFRKRESDEVEESTTPRGHITYNAPTGSAEYKYAQYVTHTTCVIDIVGQARPPSRQLGPTNL